MKFFLFTAILAAGTVCAEVVRIKSITELSNLTKDGLVIFDLDNTVFEAKGYECHANRYYEKIAEFDRVSGDNLKILKNVVYHWWEASQNSCDVKLVEKEFDSVFKKLQSDNIPIIALTARGGTMKNATLRQLDQIGISFSKTPLSGDACETLNGFNGNGEALFCKGVLFASPAHSKEDVLKAYFDKFNYEPKKIVFVDDLKKNLDDFENSFTGIDFKGYHYPLVEIRTKH